MTTPPKDTGIAAQRHKKHRRRSKPLKVTPPLGQGQYVFPVVGASDYVDTYGALRTDVPGNWHHGDDIFAPLGAPVVAVASGTINRVGWEKVGGWRLWVRDSAGDEFYYAHLSGYAPADFHSSSVRAGEVVGFIGNTGDAFPGAPHLHFEVHPRQLLRLGYGGAVDPTTYLDSWSHLESVQAPRPVHPRLPKRPSLRSQARYVFRELLAARHLIKDGPKASEWLYTARPEGESIPSIALLPIQQAAPKVNPQRRGGMLIIPLLVGLGSLALFATTILVVRLRRARIRRPATREEADATAMP